MIEVVYSGEEHEEQDEVRIPKNIHQIGNNSSNKKIYIEDYVMTYLKKSPSGEDNVKYGVLLGDVKRAKGNVYIFVKGMVEVRDVIENSIIFNDDIWSGIYKDIKQFFEQLNIVGWYVSVPYRVSEDMNGIRKIHLDNFAGNDKVCFVKDRAENEEGFYSYEQSGLGKQQGYYIYYEKNEKMKKYVKNLKNSATNSGIANNEIKNISVDDKIGGEDKKDKKSSKKKLENIELKAEEANGKTIKISKEESKQDNNLNKKDVEKLIEENKIEAVLNFAGYKAVGESVKKPLEYYENNISGALVLLETMRKYNVKKFIFSSSATVYGEPERIPLTEDCKIGGTTNPYGTTKLFIEQILQDLYKSDNTWDIAILRYFNPVGAHESGLIGEEPQGIPNNLMPYIVRVASGELEQLSIFGNDYNTPDGTGVRDYIHVVDLAKGHIKALEKLEKENSGIYIYNLGTGVGYSVLDMVKAFEESTGKKVNYKIVERRAGDIATCYSDPQKAKNELHWEATKTLNDMCKDSWKYIQNRKK